MSLLMRGESTSAVEVTNVSPHGFWLLIDGEEFLLPFSEYPWFRDASIAAIFNVQRLHGEHLYWPDLDVDLEIDTLHHPEKYPLIAR